MALFGKSEITRKIESGHTWSDKSEFFREYYESMKGKRDGWVWLYGIINFIKEDYDRLSQEYIPRKYFSGGLDKLSTISLKRISRPVVSNNAKHLMEVGVSPKGNEGGILTYMKEMSKTAAMLTILFTVTTFIAAGCGGGNSSGNNNVETELSDSVNTDDVADNSDVPGNSGVPDNGDAEDENPQYKEATDDNIRVIINTFTDTNDEYEVGLGEVGSEYWELIKDYDPMQTVPLLISTLHDPSADPVVRGWCACLMGKVALPSQFEEVLNVLASVSDYAPEYEYDGEHEDNAFFGLGYLFANMGFDFSIDYINDERPIVREAVIIGFTEYVADSKIGDHIIDILENTEEDPGMSHWALRSAHNIYDIYDNREHLFEKLLDWGDAANGAEGYLKSAALWSLGHIGDGRALPLMMKEMDINYEKDPLVRQGAVDASKLVVLYAERGFTVPPELMEALIKAADYRIEEADNVRASAVYQWTIVNQFYRLYNGMPFWMTEYAFDTLVFALLHDPAWKVRANSAEAFKAVEETDAIPYLEEALATEEHEYVLVKIESALRNLKNSSSPISRKDKGSDLHI